MDDNDKKPFIEQAKEMKEKYQEVKAAWDRSEANGGGGDGSSENETVRSARQRPVTRGKRVKAKFDDDDDVEAADDHNVGDGHAHEEQSEMETVVTTDNAAVDHNENNDDKNDDNDNKNDDKNDDNDDKNENYEKNAKNVGKNDSDNEDVEESIEWAEVLRVSFFEAECFLVAEVTMRLVWPQTMGGQQK